MISEQKRTVAVELILNCLVPWLLYSYLTDYRHWSEYHSLLAVSVIPAVVGVWELITRRQVDFIAVFSFVSIVIGVVLAAATSDVRLMQIRESYLTLAFGLAFLGSSLIGRPLCASLVAAQGDKTPKGPAIREELEKVGSPLRGFVFATNWLWGLVFVFEFGVKIWMIESLTIKQVLGWGPIVLGIMTGLGVLLNLGLAWRMRQNIRQSQLEAQQV